VRGIYGVRLSGPGDTRSPSRVESRRRLPCSTRRRCNPHNHPSRFGIRRLSLGAVLVPGSRPLRTDACSAAEATSSREHDRVDELVLPFSRSLERGRGRRARAIQNLRWLLQSAFRAALRPLSDVARRAYSSRAPTRPAAGCRSPAVVPVAGPPSQRALGSLMYQLCLTMAYTTRSATSITISPIRAQRR
jgi:hypothetical protein